MIKLVIIINEHICDSLFVRENISNKELEDLVYSKLQSFVENYEKVSMRPNLDEMDVRILREGWLVCRLNLKSEVLH